MNYIKKVARILGFEISRYTDFSDQTNRLIKYLSDRQIDCIFDVGANVGQFATSMIEGGYKGRIVSFEALPSAYPKLQEKARKHEVWEVAPMFALGSSDGVTQFNVADNSVSSSLKSPSSELESEGIEFDSGKVIEVEVRKLDTVFGDHRGASSKIFLKLDVQGAELEVLRGAIESLPSIDGVLSEMNTMQLYQGISTCSDVDDFICKKGFELWDIETGFRSKSSGRLLQYDAVYFSTEN